ncbi:MAG: c-type cytochrome [Sulfobacillus sp.]
MKGRQLWGFVTVMIAVLTIGGVLWYQHQQAVATIQLQTREATAGQALFAAMCETCHGPGGNGAGGAPVLNDGAVLQKYSTPASLSAFISSNMPASDPGILTTQEATDLTLYIFQLSHQFPPTHG